MIIFCIQNKLFSIESTLTILDYGSEYTNDHSFSLKGNFGLANLEHEISEVHPIPTDQIDFNCHHGMAIMILIGSFLIDFRQIRLRLRNYAEPKKRCFIRTQIGIHGFGSC